MKQQGFIRSHADYNLYYKSEGGRLCVLVLYVDDLIITGNDLLLVEQIKAALCQRFGVAGEVSDERSSTYLISHGSERETVVQ